MREVLFSCSTSMGWGKKETSQHGRGWENRKRTPSFTHTHTHTHRDIYIKKQASDINLGECCRGNKLRQDYIGEDYRQQRTLSLSLKKFKI